MIGVPRHGRAPCLPRDQGASSQKCEATGKKHATLWRLTSPITPAILGGVGRSPGDCVALEAGPRCLGGLGHGERLQTLPLTSSLVAEHSSGERAKLSLPDDLNNRSNSQSVGFLLNSREF
jgi:hypothetical protein